VREEKWKGDEQSESVAKITSRSPPAAYKRKQAAVTAIKWKPRLFC
jgi:hypothetical protein